MPLTHKTKVGIAIGVALVIVFGAGLYLWNRGVIKTFLDLRQSAQRVATTIDDQIQKRVEAPPPLRGAFGVTNPTSNLTTSGVLAQTNMQRADNGNLPSLAQNATLARAAQNKLDDLFSKQYFDHVSPTGVGPAQVVEAVGYQYLTIGENLALGDFADDKSLVDAWMASPGHRANILNNDFQEIGIAVGQGIYEGKKTWIAVQEFGKPLAACPSPDTALKAQIDADNATLDQQEARLQSERQHIADEGPGASTYQQDSTAYNNDVNTYNVLVAKVKEEVAQYNSQVQAFNACVAK